MISTILAGVRDLRTPFVVGVLWALLGWILIPSSWTDLDDTSRVVKRLSVATDFAGSTSVLAALAFGCLLLGSLLVVRHSPFRLITRPARAFIEDRRWRLDAPDLPATKWKRPVWRLWQRHSWRPPMQRWLKDDSSPGLENWLRLYYEDLLRLGKVPVMHGWRSCVGEPGGLESLDEASTYTDNWEMGESLRDNFLNRVIGERASVELRIQMQYPEVYSDIDRLRSEAELRLSVFWPLIAHSVVAAFALTGWAAMACAFPILLLVTGARRRKESVDKTWDVMTAEKVTSPTLDAIERHLESSSTARGPQPVDENAV